LCNSLISSGLHCVSLLKSQNLTIYCIIIKVVNGNILLLFAKKQSDGSIVEAKTKAKLEKLAGSYLLSLIILKLPPKSAF
jgi:hypothetical protein